MRGVEGYGAALVDDHGAYGCAVLPLGTTGERSGYDHLETIYRVMNSQVFGLRQSEKIVGGRSRLLKLIEQGHIRADKGNTKAQNGKWLCNASDVLRYAKVKY